MAFLLKARTNGFGVGGLGALNATTQNMVINSYAQVTGISGGLITLGNISDWSKFKVQNFVLVHVSGYKGTGTFSYLGNWICSRILEISGNTLTLYNKQVEAIAGGNSNALIQVVTIPEYTTVTINANSSITCPQFNQTKGYGGIVAMKCSEELKLAGGGIDLYNKGLPSASLRPLFNFETQETRTGYENYQRESRLPINYPHGAAFLLAKKLTCHEDSRIGQPKLNSQKPRHLESLPGGANIFIAAEEISEFNPMIISKSGTSSGVGRAGCYIATESCLPCDEGLYAYDRIATPDRMSSVFKVKNFGDGSHGAKTNYTNMLNSYAAVSSMDSTRKVLTIGGIATGLAKIQKGALVMVRADYKSSKGIAQYSGHFILARVLDYSGNKVTLDTAFEDLGGITNANYGIQMIAIPQFTDFTLNKTNESMLKYENWRGGIVALACSGTCDLRGGKILTEGKGGVPASGEEGLNYISNAQMAEKLPIGEGNGSVFILAKNLILDSNTRLGGSWTGAAEGGSWTGTTYNSGYGSGSAEHGSGSGGGVCQLSSGSNKYNLNGGYNSNGSFERTSATANSDGGYQGAHILIVADKITNMNLASLSTGGQRNTHANYVTATYTPHYGADGGCGFGGGSGYFLAKSSNQSVRGGSGGYLGGGAGRYSANSYLGGGGSGAFCFVYCNSFENEDKTLLTFD